MLKIRLRRMGNRHRPFYRVVVSDSLKTPTAKALEELGTYDPQKNPSAVNINLERFDHWVSQGAQPSATLRKLASKLRNAKPVEEATEEAPVKGKGKAAKAPAKEAKATKEAKAPAKETPEAKEAKAPAKEAPADDDAVATEEAPAAEAKAASEE